MLLREEKIKNFRLYLNKLSKFLREEAVMSLFATKLFPKNRIDDILCCIDANIPREYKTFIKSHGKKQLKSYEYYLELVKIVKGSFIIKDYYRVNCKQALQMIELIISYLNQDMKYIETNS